MKAPDPNCDACNGTGKYKVYGFEHECSCINLNPPNKNNDMFKPEYYGFKPYYSGYYREPYYSGYYREYNFYKEHLNKYYEKDYYGKYKNPELNLSAAQNMSMSYNSLYREFKNAILGKNMDALDLRFLYENDIESMNKLYLQAVYGPNNQEAEQIMAENLNKLIAIVRLYDNHYKLLKG